MVHIADEGGTEIERDGERQRERERRDKSSEPARAI